MPSRPLEIVYLVDSLIRGGVQRGLLLRSARMDRARFRPQVWVLRRGENNWEMAREFADAGVPVRLARVRGFSDRPGIVALARSLLDENIDVLSTHNFLANIVGKAAGRIAHRPAVVANYHQTYETYWNDKFLAMEATLRATPHRFVCVSQAVRDYVAPLLNLPDDRVVVLYNGFDYERFASAPAQAQARDMLGLPRNRPVVGFVGRLAPVKDAATFVRAMPAIARSLPDPLFVLAGGGQLRGDLESQAQALGVSGRTRFLGSRDDVPVVMRALDCLVLPSRVEGFGRVVVEAFAAKTPVVATPVGAVPELMGSGRHGLLFAVGDADALARAVCDTLTNCEATARRVAHAHDSARRFGVDRWVEETQQLFQTVCEESRLANDEARTPTLTRRYWQYRTQYCIVRLARRGRSFAQRTTC